MSLFTAIHGNETVKEFAEYYLNRSIMDNYTDSTYKSYRTRLENHVLPMLGDIKIKDLKKIDVQNLVSSLKNQTPPLSANTIRLVRSILNRVLDFAVDMDLIGKNVADRIIMPKQAKYQPRTYTNIEIQSLLQAAKDTNLYLPILLAVRLGLRRSEILSLQWKDVDFNSKTITVTKTASERPLGYPKTRNSYRCLQIPDNVMSDLKRHWASQNGNMYVVSKADNSPYNPSYISRAFNELLKAHNLPSIRFHDLRHTYATRAYSNGMPVKELSVSLGHNSAATTLDYYVHL